MLFRKKFIKLFTPIQLLVSGYLFVTLAGAFLLSIPAASQTGKWQNFIDALFTATSGISTTGLSVVDIGGHYTFFGQVVLLCIFQIGGIGYMTFIIFFSYVLGMRTALVTQIVARESLSGPDLRTLGKFFYFTIIFTAGFELAGALVLSLFWARDHPIFYSLYLGFFHSISAFCTAGFSLFPDSLMKYHDNILINLTIDILSLAGGIGFFVLYDLYVYFVKTINGQQIKRLSIHSKLVMIATSAVVLLGTIIIMKTETWSEASGPADRFMISAFQAISASTTDGFNSIDIGKMGAAGLTAIMALMFIGASPGSTGGGIKTSTMGLIIIFLINQIRGRDDNVNIFNREISSDHIKKAFGVFSWFIIIIFINMIFMSVTEKGTFMQIIFEIVSALGNTGLSMGITADLSSAGRIFLILTMFIGRVGPLTIGYFLFGRQKPLPFRYAQEDIFIG